MPRSPPIEKVRSRMFAASAGAAGSKSAEIPFPPPTIAHDIIDRLEDELRKARDEIQRLHELQRQEELQNSQDETQHLWDDLLEEVSID